MGQRVKSEQADRSTKDKRSLCERPFLDGLCRNRLLSRFFSLEARPIIHPRIEDPQFIDCKTPVSTKRRSPSAAPAARRIATRTATGRPITNDPVLIDVDFSVTNDPRHRLAQSATNRTTGKVGAIQPLYWSLA